MSQIFSSPHGGDLAALPYRAEELGDDYQQAPVRVGNDDIDAASLWINDRRKGD